MKEITVVGGQMCPRCTMLKKFLTENCVEFTEVDIDENIEISVELSKVGVTHLPAIKIAGGEYKEFDNNFVKLMEVLQDGTK